MTMTITGMTGARAAVSDAVAAKGSAAAGGDFKSALTRAEKASPPSSPAAVEQSGVAQEPDKATEPDSAQQAPDKATVQPDAAQEPDKVTVQPDAAQGIDKVTVQPDAAQGPDKAALQPDAVQEPDDQPDPALSAMEEEGNRLPPEAEPMEQGEVALKPSVEQEEQDKASPAPEAEPATEPAPVVLSVEGVVRPSSDAAPAAKADATPDWLAQIEHGRRWQARQGQAAQPEASPTESRLDELKAESEDSAPAEQQEGRFQTGQLAASRGGFFLQAGQEPGSGADEASPAVSVEAGLPLHAREQWLPVNERTQPVSAERAMALQQGVPEQNARQMAQQVQVMVNQNMQEADIQLSPSELGGMRIQIKIEHGEASVQFLAHHPQARELLDQAMPRLRDMLGQQGIQLGQGQVSSFAGQGNAPDGHAPGQGGAGRQNTSAAAGGAEDEDWQPVSGFSARPENGLIDYFA